MELDSEAKAHAERRRILEEEDRATKKQKSDGNVEAQQIVERIGRMSMPNSVKQRLQTHVSSSFASVYTTSSAAAAEGEGEAGDGVAQPVVDAAVVGLQEDQETPAL